MAHRREAQKHSEPTRVTLLLIWRNTVKISSIELVNADRRNIFHRYLITLST